MTKSRYWIAIAGAVTAAAITLTLAAEPRGNAVQSRTAEALSPKQLDRLATRLSRQLREPALTIQEGADPDVVEGGYLAPYHGENDLWNDILQVSRPDNPLITAACRERSRARVLNNASDRAVMLDHLRGQMELWEQVRQEARHLRLSEILLHLADCRLGCAAHLSGVLSCHIEGVRSRPRTIVYFDPGRPRAYEERSFAFSRRDQRRIAELARLALAEGRDILIFSRVSGAAAFDQHNLSGNNTLAWRRARMVDKELSAAGVPRDRVRWKILSWETPRLAASDVAAAYGFLDDWQAMADKGSMDHSVVLVAH